MHEHNSGTIHSAYSNTARFTPYNFDYIAVIMYRCNKLRAYINIQLQVPEKNFSV